MMAKWFDQGGAIDAVPVDDRGLQYGDGLFETIAIRNGRPRLPGLHIERLQTGCERLRMQVPADGLLLGMLDHALASTGCSGGAVVKLIATRGSGPRGYRHPENPAPRILLGLFDSLAHARDHWTHGVELRICNVRLGSQPALAGIKSLNRLEQVLARNEWQDHSVADGIMLDADCNIVCGTMSNLFFVSDGRLLTPEITTCGVSGVMRRHIIALSGNEGLAVGVKPVPIRILQECSEVFLSNSQIGVWPVRRCGTNSYVAPGPTTRRVMALLAAAGIDECRI